MGTLVNQNNRILVINTGSTSSKIALFEEENELWRKSLEHRSGLRSSDIIALQFESQKQLVDNLLEENQINGTELDAVVGRGGLLKPVEGGTYLVNQKMLTDARRGERGWHPANLGCLLAHFFAKKAHAPAFVVDPISVDELEPLARYSGHPLIKRSALSHALSIHAAARIAAKQLEINYKNSRFIVVHLGGGISVAPVIGGKIIDVNDAASSGPFSPERTGGLPLQPFIGLCFSGNYTEAEMRRLVMGEGGLRAYLGSSNAREIEDRIQNGDREAAEAYDAMIYQVAKEVGAMATVLLGDVQAIVVTGGLANSKLLTDELKKRIAFLSKVLILPGEFEMQAMNAAVLDVLHGRQEVKAY